MASLNRASILKRLTSSPRPRCQSCEDVSVCSVAYCCACKCLYCDNCWKEHLEGSPACNNHSITRDQTLTEHEEGAVEVKDSSSHAEECVDVVTPQVVMDKRQSGVNSYHRFSENMEKLDQVMIEGEQMTEKIKQSKEKVDAAIMSAFDKLRQELNDRENTLLSESSDYAARKSKHLSLQIKELAQLKAEMEACHKLATEAKSREQRTEVSIEEDHLLTKFFDLSLDLCENANIAVDVNTDHVMGDIKSFGYVASGASPKKSTVTGLPSKLTVGREVSVRVHTCNDSGKKIGHGGEVVQGMLTAVGKSRSKVMATTSDVGDGTYLLSMKPKEEGDQILSLSIHGQHVQGSPFVLPPAVSASGLYTSLKSPVHTVTGVNGAHYIAFHHSGDMFVTSYDDHCVYVYDTHCTRKATIGKKGKGNLEFDHPYGIVISGDKVYVADCFNHRVQSFTTSGKFLRKFGSRGCGSSQFNRPMGISIDSNNLFYVSDSDNHRIQVFRPDWSLCRTIEGNVSGKGFFKRPFGVTIAPDGNLFIAAYGSGSVMVFTVAGKYIRCFQANSPTGVAVDAAGFCLVISCAKSGTLSVFSPSGSLICKVDRLHYPKDVKISSGGSVWITECGGHKVSKYL